MALSAEMSVAMMPAGRLAAARSGARPAVKFNTSPSSLAARAIDALCFGGLRTTSDKCDSEVNFQASVCPFGQFTASR